MSDYKSGSFQSDDFEESKRSNGSGISNSLGDYERSKLDDDKSSVKASLKPMIKPRLNPWEASPSGVIVAVVGVVLSIAAAIVFRMLETHTETPDFQNTIRAIGLIGFIGTVAVAVSGIQIIVLGYERHELHRRLDIHDAQLDRIESARAHHEEVKKEVAARSRSFWDRFKYDGS